MTHAPPRAGPTMALSGTATLGYRGCWSYVTGQNGKPINGIPQRKKFRRPSPSPVSCSCDAALLGLGGCRATRLSWSLYNGSVSHLNRMATLVLK